MPIIIIMIVCFQRKFILNFGSVFLLLCCVFLYYKSYGRGKNILVRKEFKFLKYLSFRFWKNN
jgi:hypothetical protein